MHNHKRTNPISDQETSNLIVFTCHYYWYYYGGPFYADLACAQEEWTTGAHGGGANGVGVASTTPYAQLSLATSLAETKDLLLRQ